MIQDIHKHLSELSNNAERLIFLNELKKEIESLEKGVKQSLTSAPIKHSRLSYVERKTWKPSQEIKKDLDVIDLNRKALIKLSKDKGQGEYEVTKVITVKATPKAEPTPSQSGQDYSSFFGL